MTNTVESIKDAMARQRAERTHLPKGAAIHQLNMWIAAERKKLTEEYNRRRDEIDAQVDTAEDKVGQEVLDLVAQAVSEGASRSAIRVALGKQNLQEVDEIIAGAKAEVHTRIEQGDQVGYVLTPTGAVHAKGWPMYRVTLLDTDETHESVYLVMPKTATEVKRSHMRISPSPAGSSEILDQLWDLGVGVDIFEKGV